MLNYQDDLIRQLTQGRNTGIAGGGQLGSVNVPGLQSPGERAPDLAGDTPPAKQMPASGNYHDIFTNIMGNYGYGHDALTKAKPDLEKAGFKVYVGDGITRGRIEQPDGDRIDVFDPREGRTKENNWATNPIQNGQWAWNNIGRDTGGGRPQQSGGGVGLNALGGLHSLLMGNPTHGINAALGQYTEQGDYLKALLAQLGV